MFIKDFCVLHGIGRRDVYRIKAKLGLCFERNEDGYVDLTPSQCNIIKREWVLHKQTCVSKLFAPKPTHDTQGNVTLCNALSFLKDTGMLVTLKFNYEYNINMLNKTEEQQLEIYRLYKEYIDAPNFRRNAILNELERVLR